MTAIEVTGVEVAGVAVDSGDGVSVSAASGVHGCQFSTWAMRLGSACVTAPSSTGV